MTTVEYHRGPDPSLRNQRRPPWERVSHWCKSSRAHNWFPNLGVWQSVRESPGNLTLKASGIWLQNFHRTGETDSWRAQIKLCVHLDPGERSSGLTRDWARLACEWPGVPSKGMGWQWPTMGSGALNTTVLVQVLLKKVAITTITLGQTTGSEHSPTHQEKIGLKFYWAGLYLSEQHPDSPIASLSHQEAATASYPYPSEGRQNGNHNYRKLTKLINWITALSYSVQLWAMPSRAIQDRWVMVESSDKTLSTGEGNGKPHQYSCLENPMNSMKRQKDRTLKDELPRSVGAQYATGEVCGETVPGRMKRLSHSENKVQLWMWLVMEVSPML